MQEMGSRDTTAQVHPELLTKALLEAAKKAAGTSVRIATVDGIKLSDDNKVEGERAWQRICGLSGMLSVQQKRTPAAQSGQLCGHSCGPVPARAQGLLIALVVLFAAHVFM